MAALVGAILAFAPASPYYTQLGRGDVALPISPLPPDEYDRFGSERQIRPPPATAPTPPRRLCDVVFLSCGCIAGLGRGVLLFYAWPPRRWPLAAIPVLFVLAVGLPWAIFKQQFLTEFSMTTNSSGAGLMVGLWEVPHPFIWTISDEAYMRWAEENGHSPFTKEASDWATNEVVRFWITFPGYMVALIWNKFTRFIFQEVTSTRYVIPDLHFAGLIVLLSFTIMLIALFVWHRPRRLLLLGWIILFNTPIFFLTYSSVGRFYNTALPSLIVTTAVLLVIVHFIPVSCVGRCVPAWRSAQAFSFGTLLCHWRIGWPIPTNFVSRSNWRIQRNRRSFAGRGHHMPE